MKENGTSALRVLSLRRKRLFAMIAVFLGLVLAAGISEIGLRIYVAARGWTANCYATGFVFFVPDRRAGHTLATNLRLKSSTYDVRTNSLGIRGPEIAVPKPDDVYRIAVLGGSSVFGYLVGEGMDSCRVLQDELNHELSAATKKFEVINAGVPGYNLTQVRYRYEDLIAGLEPDLVILYLGWNDSRFLLNRDPDSIDRTPPAPPASQRILANSVLYGLIRFRLFPSPTPQFAPPHELSAKITDAGAQQFRDDFVELIGSVRDSGADLLISTQVMASGQGCIGVERFLGDSADQIENNRKIGQWLTQTIREIAEHTNSPLVDVASQTPCNSETLGDAIHLTTVGHRLVALAWASEVVKEFDAVPRAIPFERSDEDNRR